MTKRAGEAAQNMPMIDDATTEAWVAEAIENPLPPASWVDLTIQLRALAQSSNPDETLLTAGALLRVVSVLEEQAIFIRHPEAIVALKRLSGALFDLRHGTVHPMFKPPTQGRPPSGSAKSVTQGTAARAMSELMKGGMPQRDAAQAVAGALRGHKGLGTVTAAKVTNWRARIEEGEGPGGVVNAALYAYRRPLPADMGATALERGKALLAELRNPATSLV